MDATATYRLEGLDGQERENSVTVGEKLKLHVVIELSAELRASMQQLVLPDQREGMFTVFIDAPGVSPIEQPFSVESEKTELVFDVVPVFAGELVIPMKTLVNNHLVGQALMQLSVKDRAAA